jgi:hypothetical protein
MAVTAVDHAGEPEPDSRGKLGRYYDRDMQYLLERGGVCVLGVSGGDAR